MGSLSYKGRLLFSALIVAAFFIPAYNGISAFQFIPVAINEIDNDRDISLVDVLIVLLPLLFIPLTALVVFIRSVSRLSSGSLLRIMPLLFLLFFLFILTMGITRQLNAPGIFEMLKNMGLGFYLAALAAVLLVFMRGENFRRKHKHRKMTSPN